MNQCVHTYFSRYLVKSRIAKIMTVSWEYEPFHYPPKPVLPNLYSSVSRKQRGDRLLKENYFFFKKKR